MNCLSQLIACCTYALEQLGLYEPEINIYQARDRLSKEKGIWEKFQKDRTELWNQFQANNTNHDALPFLVEKAVTHLNSKDLNGGVAVDLGCGISGTAFNLLECGWKVYAVDSSKSVINTLTDKVSQVGKKWIENGQLVLVNQSIEEFKYPENVHLITAMDSLPYCDPEKISDIFLKAKNALLPGGVLVCSLFPYNDHPIADNMLREMFGAWMTTKNVVEAVMRSVDFPSWSVVEGRSPGGLAKQFHVFAQVSLGL
jgi:SAM-dependent methyltransferase